MLYSCPSAERNSRRCEGESFGRPRTSAPHAEPTSTVESMYIHPAVRFQCAYAGHKGEYTVGMRLVCIVSRVLSYILLKALCLFFNSFQILLSTMSTAYARDGNHTISGVGYRASFIFHTHSIVCFLFRSERCTLA